MQLYAFYVVFLVVIIFILAYYLHQKKDCADIDSTIEKATGRISVQEKEEATRFKKIYFSVYGLAIGADWLQGPYMYMHYRNSLALPEKTVAALFSTGFVSAAITATFAGTLADRYGRARACLAYCVIYFLSCFSVLSPNLTILFAGRVLGGMSTTLLFSVFEAWMIAEYNARDLNRRFSLGDMFGLAVTLGSITAVVSGLVGEAMMVYFETTAAPFMLAAACLTVAGLGIKSFWNEHYGESTTEKGSRPVGFRPKFNGNNRRILALCFATTIFEGSIYVFVFFWTSAISFTHSLSANYAAPLPLGLIFSCFMCATMLGSMVYPSIVQRACQDSKRLLLWIFYLAALALFASAVTSVEAGTFWSFMLFEACIGVYFPTMSKLKGELVQESIRATIYGLMRLPLNVYVVLILGALSGGSDSTHNTTSIFSGRNLAFIANGSLLLVAIPVMRKFL